MGSWLNAQRLLAKLSGKRARRFVVRGREMQNTEVNFRSYKRQLRGPRFFVDLVVLTLSAQFSQKRLATSGARVEFRESPLMAGLFRPSRA